MGRAREEGMGRGSEKLVVGSGQLAEKAREASLRVASGQGKEEGVSDGEMERGGSLRVEKRVEKPKAQPEDVVEGGGSTAARLLARKRGRKEEK